MNLSDRETISIIKENPYMQYFLGLNHFQPKAVFDPSLFVDFGSKISLSLNNGFSPIDRLSWDAFNESIDLKMQAEAYKSIHGVYPELIQADKIYATKENRKWLTENNIGLTAKPLGRPAKRTRYEKEKFKIMH